MTGKCVLQNTGFSTLLITFVLCAELRHGYMDVYNLLLLESRVIM